MMKKIIFAAVTALVMLSSCSKTEKYAVHAGFTTDKETYSTGDAVKITNTATGDNTLIAICKWEYLGNVVYNLEAPEPFEISEGGEYIIRQTVTGAKGGVKDVFEKTITVVDDNVPPVADFTWTNADGVAGGTVRAGEKVVFSDKSSDPDGSIISWEWSFGGDPKSFTDAAEVKAVEYVFQSHGTMEVTLKVTDNRKKSHTKTVTMEIGKSATSIGLYWSYPYADAGEVKGTSPAVSPDGKSVYVTSSAHHLVGVSGGVSGGKEICNVNLNPENATVIDKFSLTPSVADNGTVYAAGYISTTNAGFFIVKDGNVTGTGDLGKVSKVEHYFFGSPALLDYNGGQYVVLAVKNTKNENANMNGGSAHTQVFDAATGGGIIGMHANSGSFGSPVVLKNGVILASGGGDYGTRVYLPAGTNTWAMNKPDAGNDNTGNLMSGDNRCTQGGSYIAISNDGKKAYVVGLGRASTKAEVHCYDIEAIASAPNTVKPVPVWKVEFDGTIQKKVATGGCVTDEAGNVYASSCGEGSSIVAVSPDGAVLWTHKADGGINGCPAVGNDDALYYNDSELGNIVKIDLKTGAKLASFHLADGLMSSPAIAPDGVIYCTGVLGGKPTLFAVEASATAPADSWSQMGGNSTRAANKY